MGQYTHVSVTGNSVIDHAWCNLYFTDIIKDFKVQNQVFYSDHFPLSISFNKISIFSNCKKNQSTHSTAPKNFEEKIKWNESKRDYFQLFMQYNENVITHKEDTSDTLNTKLLNSILTCAAATDMKSTNTFNNAKRKNKPWFDPDCDSLKKDLEASLKKCKENKFNDTTTSHYLTQKKLYRKTLKIKKINFEKTRLEALSQVKDSSKFWKEINKYKPRSKTNTAISIQTWESHYKDIYGDVQRPCIEYFGVGCPLLDSDITLGELTSVLQKLKKESSPGSDGISNEFYEALPQNWIIFRVKLFNRVLMSEETPKSWSKIETIMIHKKNDAADPSNYRGISLVNNVTKIFTQIILNRLSKWCSMKNIFSEGQNGFRSGRSTLDNLFILNAVNHNNLRLSKRSVAVAFIDFKSAFDSLDQNMLFSKLYALGCSAKIIRIIKKFYTSTSMQVKNRNAKTNEIPVTKGVLQGEILSPILFNIFLSDLEDYLKTKGAKGAPIDGYNDIISLLFADDLLIFSCSPIDLQKSLNLLEEYADNNKLIVNTKKTNIIKFCKGNSPMKQTIKYGNELLTSVSKTNYLGVTFSKTALFREMCSNALTKARAATGRVFSTLAAAKANSWETRIKLFNTVILSTLLYGAPIWALRYTEELEKAQSYFLKNLLRLPKNTPGYLLRLETGTSPLSLTILKHSLWFTHKIASLEDHRYNKICFNRLVYLHNTPGNSIKYNWFSQITAILDRTGFPYAIADLINPDSLKSKIPLMLNSYKDKLRMEDNERALQSQFNPLFRQLTWADQPKEYLRLHVPIKVTRTIAQLRTSCQNLARINHEGLIYEFVQTEDCIICNLKEKETWSHIFLRCPLYNQLRLNYLDFIINSNQSPDIVNFLEVTNKKNILNIYYFIINSLKIRSFILNEQ